MTEDLQDGHHPRIPGLKSMKVRNLISSISYPQKTLGKAH